MTTPTAFGRWSTADAVDLYGIDRWGRDFVSVNDRGNLTVGGGLDDDAAGAVDLKALVDEVIERGIDPPLLIRFSDVLRRRIDEIQGAFARAIERFEYRGSYRGVYPIKVNQDRHLVEALLSHGRRYHHGLEAGSKPELMAVMAMLDDPDALVICNGYKDEEYVETALYASRLGLRVILVAEKPTELRLIAEVAKRVGIRPLIGMRARLSTKGAGHWQASAGDRSKFGLGARDLVEAVDFLRASDLLDAFVLLHFHVGSQVSSIRNVKNALREAGWLYVNLVKMGVPLRHLDVGGGLGVDYDGSQSSSASSMNYSVQEYANDVVYGILEVCDPAGVPHPDLITEAGRATVAHHATLVLEVLEVGEFRAGALPAAPPRDAGPILKYLFDSYHELTPENLRETYHDAQQYRDECLTLFNLGHLSLAHRVLAEDLFWALCQRIRDMLRDRPEDEIARDLRGIERAMADTYFGNFSLFQSLPDAWAIDQLFPVLPIHRLDERPTRRGVVADITCDSDGCISRFIDRHAPRPVLDLHELRDQPYYLGVFLVGAYQEILGDLHNLFGDTNTVNVSIEPGGGYQIDEVVAGDAVSEVLRYVGYQRDDLVARVRRSAERAIRAGHMTRAEMRGLLALYQEGLGGYTYLERR
ncbi:MAG: biosynthetic arginine decarboxylase [Acidobacteriota bacterium]